jgi:hypothetical protein
MSSGASTTVDSLTQALIARGILGPDASLPAAAEHRPWFVGAVLGAAGWLAGICALAFVAMLFKPHGAGQFSLIGLVLLAAAFGLYAVDRENAFFDQLALALSVAGQIALTWAAGVATHSAAGTAACAGVLQLAILAVMPNRFARTLAAFFACIAWALTIRLTWWGQDSLFNSSRDVALGPALLGWFAIWVPVGLAAEALVRTESRWIASPWRRIVRPALTGLVAALAVGSWASEPLAGLQIWEQTASRSNWLALWPLFAFLAALFATFCAFRVRNRALIGLGIGGALLHVSQFYFLLGTTLIVKSILMLVVGAALLGSAAWMRTERVA